MSHILNALIIIHKKFIIRKALIRITMQIISGF